MNAKYLTYGKQNKWFSHILFEHVVFP